MFKKEIYVFSLMSLFFSINLICSQDGENKENIRSEHIILQEFRDTREAERLILTQRADLLIPLLQNMSLEKRRIILQRALNNIHSLNFLNNYQNSGSRRSRNQ